MVKLDTGASFYNGCTIPFPDFIKMCYDLEMKYIEIQMEPPFAPPEIDSKLKETVIDCLGTYSIAPTVHGPYDDINLASFKERIRRASLDIMKDCIDFTDDLGATIIVIHGGACSVHQMQHYEHAVQRFRASLLELAMYAHDRGIRIGLENKQIGVDREVILYPQEHYNVVQEYADFDVRAVVDLGHANTADINLTEYLEKMKEFLIEVHVHDNDGTSDTHLPLGNGNAEIRGPLKVLDRIKFKGPVILELDAREDLESSLNFMKNI